jgi:hypothetical protein
MQRLQIWNTLRTFGIFYDHLVHFVFIFTIFPVWYHVPKKSGNPGESLRPVLTPVHGMEYCVGLGKEVIHFRNSEKS